MTGLQLGAVLLISAGILALAVLEKRQADAQRRLAGEVPDKKYTRSVLAILFPILYCLIDGLGTFSDSFVLDVVMDEVTANLSYEFTFLLMAVFAFCWLTFVKKERFHPLQEKTKFAAALCETAGQFSYVFALSGNAIVAAPTHRLLQHFFRPVGPAVFEREAHQSPICRDRAGDGGHRHPGSGITPQSRGKACAFPAARFLGQRLGLMPPELVPGNKRKDHSHGDSPFFF